MKKKERTNRDTKLDMLLPWQETSHKKFRTDYDFSSTSPAYLQQ